MDTTPSTQNHNPNSSSTMAFHFIKALANIQQTSLSGGGCRGHRINRAAYASMAIAAGPRRAWSWALFQRLRSRRQHRHQRVLVIQRRRARVWRMPNRVESLRRLVPGGKGMDLCCLLEETASYVRCLSDQVTLMQTIVDSASKLNSCH